MKFFIKHDEPKPTKFSVGGMQEQYGIFELCRPSQTQVPCFAHLKKNAPLAFTSELSDNTNTFRPIVKVPWTLPIQPEAYESDLALWNEVKQCLYDHVDLSEQEGYNILTAWVFASWTLEKWKIAPYLFFFGSFGTGKSRALEVLAQLCSRGWLAMDTTPAGLYRPLESWHTTLFLDESEMYTNQHEIIGLLNSSYRRGQYVARQKENDSGDYETVFFDCFSFKAIAGTRDLAKTLRSRCIIFQTSKSTRRIKFFIDEPRCTQLRNKLLKYRFNAMLTECSERSERIWNKAEELVEEIGDQREVELFYPLLSVAPNDEIEKEILTYAKKSAGRKLEEMSLTTESQCLYAILQAKEREKIKNGRIFIGDVTIIVNEGLSLDERWSDRFTSSICSRLGFDKSKGAGGRAIIIWSDKLIERLKKDKRYDSCFISIPLELRSERSEHSVESWNNFMKVK